MIDWELPLEDYERLSSFQSQVRILNGDHFLSPDGPYQKLSDLWDDPEEDGRLEHFIKGMYKYNARAPVVPLGKGALARVEQVTKSTRFKLVLSTVAMNVYYLCAHTKIVHYFPVTKLGHVSNIYGDQ